MLQKFDYVRITLSDSAQKEGYLVDVDGNTGTLAGMNSNTAFYLPSTTIEVLHPGTKPIPLPTPLRHTHKPYRVAALVGTHTACEDYFTEETTAKSYAQSLIGQWTNKVPSKQFHQFTSVMVLMNTRVYRVGEHVQFVGSTWQGTIIAVIPDFESSGEPGHSVRMDVESVRCGALPIETVSPKLIKPIPASPYVCRDCGKPLSFPETIFVGDVPYCSDHAPSYDKHDQF